MPQHDWIDSFGAQLTRLRHEHRLTQEQLADRAGLSVRAISSLECGARRPRRLTVERLATGLALGPRERQQLVDAAAEERVPVLPQPSRPAPATPLIGRDEERETLRRQLRGDGPPLLCFLGEPGIGKSRLLAEAATIAAECGSPVWAAGCRRGGEPYAPVVDAFADYARRVPPHALAELARACPGIDLLLPELAAIAASPIAVPPGQHRRLAFDAASRLVRLAGSTSAPVVLVLDDMQWAGPAAADLLCHLVRQAGTVLRVVIAGRIGDLTPTSRLAQCLGDLARQGLMSHHRLPPLRRAAAEDLVTAVAGDPTALASTGRREILRRSAGLPLFLVELTKATIRDGADTLPGNLRIAVRQQLTDLPHPAAATLRRLAWAGTTVPIEALTTDAATTDHLLDVLEAAVHRGILEETDRGFRFRYPLMRDVLVEGLGPTRRQVWRDRGGTRPDRTVGHRLLPLPG